MVDEHLNVDIATLSGYPNSTHPSPTSGVPSFSRDPSVIAQALKITDGATDIAIAGDPKQAVHPLFEIGNIVVVNPTPQTSTNRISEDDAGYLARIVSFSYFRTDCTVELLATGRRKSVPVNVLRSTCQCRHGPSMDAGRNGNQDTSSLNRDHELQVGFLHPHSGFPICDPNPDLPPYRSRAGEEATRSEEQDSVVHDGDDYEWID
ncbi:hypothetical protein VTL71DRAFT_1960 [Oculimacula yallundae]|uniref:Uncharacterized protein n=1 Tax=Oculimacula yallundae TaxID=86028 RepID=A0ABR4CC79_9HELO